MCICVCVCVFFFFYHPLSRKRKIPCFVLFCFVQAANIWQVYMCVLLRTFRRSICTSPPPLSFELLWPTNEMALFLWYPLPLPTFTILCVFAFHSCFSLVDGSHLNILVNIYVWHPLSSVFRLFLQTVVSWHGLYRLPATVGWNALDVGSFETFVCSSLSSSVFSCLCTPPPPVIFAEVCYPISCNSRCVSFLFLFRFLRGPVYLEFVYILFNLIHPAAVFC